MGPELISGVWGAVCVLALVTSTVSLWLHHRVGSVRELESRLRQQELDLHELFDTVEKWTRRDRVRRLRDGQAAALEQPQLPQPGTPEYKVYLRRKARGAT